MENLIAYAVGFVCLMYVIVGFGVVLIDCSAHLQGEEFDKESGLSHLSHMATNALFLDYFEEKKNG